MGAYHKHFQIKPAIKLNGGLKTEKEKGVHDSDYYLEVTATNKALLTTVLSKKVARLTTAYDTKCRLMTYEKEDYLNRMRTYLSKFINA